jgi:hypothetical protein
MLHSLMAEHLVLSQKVTVRVCVGHLKYKCKMIYNQYAKYIAKENTWFKEGTEVFPLDYMYTDVNGIESYICKGTYVVGSCNKKGYDKRWYKEGFKDGDEVTMREVCSLDEFEILV